MIRIVKLTICAGLVIVLGAITANGAAAADLHSEAAHTILSGEQHAGEDTLTLQAGTFRCNHRTYVATVSTATSATLRITPTYTGCKAFGFVNATIDINGCTFVLNATSGTTSIDCPIGQSIVTTAFNCWVTTGSQGPLGEVSYTNSGTGSSRDVTIDLDISGIDYTQHSQSFPGCTNGTFTNGLYIGGSTVRGAETASNQVGVWVN